MSYNTIAFFLLILSFLSLWIRHDPKVWGGLLGLSLCLGLIGENILWIGFLITLVWAALWVFYLKQTTGSRLTLFMALILLSFGFKFHLFPGFNATTITPNFLIGFDSPLVGLFPIALLVPLAKNLKDWGKVLKGLLYGCLGIGLITVIAVGSGVVHFRFCLPTFAATRFLVNLILTTIPEEGFYRGFVQNKLCQYLKNKKGGKWIAVFLSSVIFTLAHIYWSPSIDILAFTFLASLLYGAVYLISGKIESAILCHFLLNFTRMTFFS